MAKNDDVDMARRKVTVPKRMHESQPVDHLQGIGKMVVIHDREKNDMVKHDATLQRPRHPPGVKCEHAACAAGAMKDIGHFRGKREGERKASAWHADTVGPTTPGIGVDAVGNLLTGTHAIILCK